MFITDDVLAVFTVEFHALVAPVVWGGPWKVGVAEEVS